MFMSITYKYDLENRTFIFARDVRAFLRTIPRDVINFEDIKQLTRSSGSVGANYLEANEGLSTKDFYYRLKICKKEAKESAYWLSLLFLNNDQVLDNERNLLIREANEFVRIFSSIVSRHAGK
ncbi:MAG: four helix bundle protein [Balneola sp.]|nr:MAG: four helix bundle protein [Balneola sp.]